MATITTLANNATGLVQRTAINDNFANLNADKAEKSGGTFTGAISATNLSGTNTGDQTSIVGITGTTAQFNTAITDGDMATLAGTNTFTGVNTFTSPLITNGAINFNAPEGFMVNGKIVPSVASGNLTLTLTGTSATLSATNPCYVMIGGVTRTITANVVTSFLNAGTNWGNAGSTELATKEVDWFCYILDYNNAGTAFNLGISRYPLYTNLSEVTGGYTSEKYLMQAGNTGIENVVNIGRFAATLSAGAGYTWSIPTYTASNLIQRPIYETRTVVGSNWTPTLTWNGTAPTGGTNKNFMYNIVGEKCYIAGSVYAMTAGVGNTLLTVTLPFAGKGGAANIQLINSIIASGVTPNLTMGEINYNSASLSIKCTSVNADYLQFQGFYNI